MISIANKILIPQKAGWDYEGVMTVGYTDDGNLGMYGYGSGWMGSMNPANPQVSGYGVTHNIFWDFSGLWVYNYSGGAYKSCNFIEIDGVLFEWGSGYSYPGASNPFPGEGETCIIKMK